MFSPLANALDLNSRLTIGRLVSTPLIEGVWALLEPADIQNHAPQLCWIKEDCLACVWMAGGQEGTSGMSIYMSELKDGRGRWTKPKNISQDKNRSEQNPLLFLDGDGKLQLVHTAQCSRELEDNSWQSQGSSFSMQWTAVLRSQNRKLQGGRWSKANNLLDESAFCRHPPYRRVDGSFLLPIYRSLETGGAFGHDFSQVLILGNDGKSIEACIDVPNSIGRVHGSIVISSDSKNLLQFFRSRLADRIYCSIGNLDGTSWTEPTPTNLPNNNSSIQAYRLASGKLAMIFNRFCLVDEDCDAVKPWGEAKWPRTRWPLSIAISDDDGCSWPWVRDIDTGYGFCGLENWQLNGQLAYPSLVEGYPGDLHIAYSWAGRRAIRYLYLKEENIIGYSTDR